MSGGLRHHSDEAVGPSYAVGYKRHRRKITTVSHQAVHIVLMENHAPRVTKRHSLYLDIAGVVRDVEKVRFSQNSQNFGIENVYPNHERRLKGFLTQSFSDQFSGSEVFNRHACSRQLFNIHVHFFVCEVRISCPRLNGSSGARPPCRISSSPLRLRLKSRTY